MKKPLIISSNGILVSSGGDSTGTSHAFNNWGHPERMEVNEYEDRIEIIYKETSIIVTTGFCSVPEKRVFKIIFSCIDGRWNKSNPVYGKIIAAQDECYEFE